MNLIRFIYHMVGLFLIAPIVLYAILLIKDAVYYYGKNGFSDAPLLFIGLTGIVSFVGYSLIVASTIIWYGKKKSDKQFIYIGVVPVIILVLYVTAFVTSCYGITMRW